MENCYRTLVWRMTYDVRIHEANLKIGPYKSNNDRSLLPDEKVPATLHHHWQHGDLLVRQKGNGGGQMCKAGMDANIESIPSKHLSISGILRLNSSFFLSLILIIRRTESLQTTNVIMANWSKEMWQSVVNRAVRTLASGPFRSHFFTAMAVVS
ncbi:hypothetical protein KIN20_030758 [Parelaphostrongylus tenuis]|uniref:Uncharacterized protein n=1 Tax=Parelaphostrongylus tenuis TaxID=148309 RepID=A0AAD5R5P5_PARTN|nr:hypothetical protein KIN20_030758 [Parelaphostrongylus tenuis]